MITSFSGDYAFLSNFYICDLVVDGIHYRSVEHAYQAAKCVREEDFERIRLAPTPGKAKRLGQTVQKRSNWEDVKVHIMLELVRKKFIGNEKLRAQLKATGEQELVEGNEWGDKEWGCMKEDGKWVGENKLGKILMVVRGAC